MAEFLNSVSAVLIIFLIQSVGYLMGRLGWMAPADKRFVSKYLMNLAVPVNCIVGVLNNFHRSNLLDAGMQFLVGFVVVGLGILVGHGVGKLMGLPRKRLGVFAVMCGVSNSMFIGLPVTQQLFGAVSLPYMMAYFLASTIYTQSVAVFLCVRSGDLGRVEDMSVKKIFLDVLKKPPIIGILLAILLLLTDLRPPEVLMKTGQYIANTVTPLALFYCGFILYEVGLKNLRLQQGISVMLVIRLVLAPLFCLGLCAMLGITGLARDVSVIMSGLPVVTQVTVMAGAYGADEQYAAVGSCLSMLGMFISLPVWMLIL